MERDLKIIAIIAAYNEEDIIGQAVGDLIGQGIQVYLLDHGSSDGTVRSVEPYLDTGLLRIERFPADNSPADPDGERFALARVIARKQQLAGELDADWFINSDADEFRESVWAHLNLREGIGLVDRLGYNAIDFQLLNFRPTHDEFALGDDVRRSFQYYEPGDPWDRVQIRCWKRGPVPAELVSTAGHEASFESRKVFPLRFLLRHYPIRSQAHGSRKVFQERRPRFAEEERQRGWHVQYDALNPGHCFIRDSSSLRPYDPDEIRAHLQVHHRLLEQQVADNATGRRQLAEARDQLAGAANRAEELALRVERTAAELAGLRATFDLERRDLQAAGEKARQQWADRVDDLERRLAGIYESRSWKLTAPLRAAQRLARRR